MVSKETRLTSFCFQGLNGSSNKTVKKSLSIPMIEAEADDHLMKMEDNGTENTLTNNRAYGDTGKRPRFMNNVYTSLS